MSRLVNLALGAFEPLDRRHWLLVLVIGVVLFVIRVTAAIPFWNSGMTKWVMFPTQLGSSVKFLFANQFKLHLPGGPYDMPFPEVMAWLSGMGEIVLPVLIVLGILSRPAALGLLFMTLIIQLTIPGGWPLHVQWALWSLVILVAGPGCFSVDWLVRRFGMRKLPAHG